MKNFHFIVATQGDSVRWWWELFVQLANFREMGYSHLSRILLFIPYRSEVYKGFKQLEQTFPEAKFFYYQDTTSQVFKLINAAQYPPVCRLYCLREHFKEFPLLQDDAIFYHDTDVIFIDKLNFTPFIQDETVYLSDTKSYINADYFDSKKLEENIRPDLWTVFEKRDILQECAEFAGIDRATCVEYKDVSGGAQYILKDVNAEFFEDCIESCLYIRNHLRFTNQQFFKGDNPVERESNGYQSWCADMWAILWNLWKEGWIVQTPKELDFLWATNEIKKIEHQKILHNAGVTSEEALTRKFGKETIHCPAFYKDKYKTSTPFEDTERLKSIINNPTSALYCTSLYVKAILDTKAKYNL